MAPSKRLVSASQDEPSKAQLLERVAALEQFCAAVAHDLRGPIGAVSMKLEHLLAVDESAKLSPKWVAMLQSAHDSLERTTTLLQTMYDCTRAKKSALQKSTLSLNQIVREVLTDIHASRKAQVEVGILPIVVGSTPLLRQLFQNLIANAITHAAKSFPQVIIDARDEEGGDVVVVITDNGKGFSHALDVSAPSKNGGVGLFIAQQIAQLHGGSISVIPADHGVVEVRIKRNPS